ncbi:MAG: ferredoxin [Pseudomonadota bacterium]
MTPADHLSPHLTPHGLTVLGRCPTLPQDDLPGAQSLALIGPCGGFWEVFRGSPEATDGAPDPLDRWSRRVLEHVAGQTNATAVFPFGGPPWHPFIGWALRTGRIWTSPVELLVHDTHGLFVSFRGALALPEAHQDTPAQSAPCDTCPDQPCRTACPADALTPAGYDVPACHAHLDRPEGAACLSGCLVRRACPIGQGLRPEAQSAFHMAAFHRSP